MLNRNTMMEVASTSWQFIKSSLFASANKMEANIFTEKFDPKKTEHAAFINERLKLFIEKRNKLLGIDHVLEIGASIDVGLFYIGGVLGFVGGVGLAVALTYYVFFQENRLKQSQEFQQALADLLETYKWCTKNNSVEITKSEIFLSLVIALAPYVSTKDLIPWDLRRTEAGKLGKGFAEYLSYPPHNVQFIGMLDHPLAEPEESQDNFNYPAKLKNLVDQFQQGKVFRLFPNAVADFRRLTYGKAAPKEEENGYNMKKR